MECLEDHLKRLFGYNEFRPLQKEIVTAVMEGKDVIAILPTGAGKSICYQLPSMLMPGVAVVISPLISLMQDQVVSLYKNGLSAAFLNSSLASHEIHSVMNSLKETKLLYVAPERFADEQFIRALQEATVSFFAIDEAHCISQWGHSFRPEYRKLSILKEKFPKSAMIALTATATKEVERDIITQLSMKAPNNVRSSFDRPNLSIQIEPRKDQLSQLRQFLDRHLDQSGIVYAATRKAVDETFEHLKKLGFKVGKYHAGMSDQERSSSQHDFIHGELLIMVATVAFGMGIHKPDIRYVVHLAMPRSIEQYYQEIGRAGRDGLPSTCLMLYSSQEIMIYNLFLEQLTDETVRKTAKAKTEKMLSLCRSSACRRKELLRYFDEIYPSSQCGNCDNCVDHHLMADETVLVQKVLSCVIRLKQQFGVKHVIDVLRGAKTKAILERGHDQLSTYNLLPELSEADLRLLIDHLIEDGVLKRTEGDYPVLQLTPLSKQVIQGEHQVYVRKKISKVIATKPKKELTYDEALFQKLSSLRKSLAQEQQVPAFVVFGDRTLIEMCQARPTSCQAMLNLNGMGPIKWQKYGAKFLDVIDSHLKESGG